MDSLLEQSVALCLLLILIYHREILSLLTQRVKTKRRTLYNDKGKKKVQEHHYKSNRDVFLERACAKASNAARTCDNTFVTDLSASVALTAETESTAETILTSSILSHQSDHGNRKSFDRTEVYLCSSPKVAFDDETLSDISTVRQNNRRERQIPSRSHAHHRVKVKSASSIPIHISEIPVSTPQEATLGPAGVTKTSLRLREKLQRQKSYDCNIFSGTRKGGNHPRYVASNNRNGSTFLDGSLSNSSLHEQCSMSFDASASHHEQDSNSTSQVSWS
jgi:hypothetical protein